MFAKSFDYSGVESKNEKNNEKSKDETQQPTLTRRHTLTEDEAKQLDEECMQRFLKINCKIITHTKGTFDGVLIITPSALMFDPLDMPIEISLEETDRNQSSSSGNLCEEASAIIPIEIISNVIMYESLPLKDVQEYFEYQNQME
jgi:hypothetical protein